ILVRNDPHWSLEEQLAGTQFPTHIGRLLQDLGVGYIAAHSPQAKGRIERLWETLQDRLVSELRLRRIATVEMAQAYLPTFIADYNRRFGKPPAAATAVWRRPPRDLPLLLGCRYHRRVAHDNTVQVGPRWIQLRGRRSYAGQGLEVRELLDGRLLALHAGVICGATPAPGPSFTLKPRRAPSADRPRLRARARLGLTFDELHVLRSVAIALDHARAWIATALALRPVARKRDEGSVEVHELTRVHRAATEAPRSVGRQLGQELQAPDTAHLVAVGVHLRHANGERPAEPRRLQRDDTVRPSRPVVDP